MKISTTITLFLVVCLASALAAPKWHQLEDYSFEKYIKDFGKSYAYGQYQYRKSVFNQRLAEIKAHNLDGTKSWKMGVNQFTDNTHEEFMQLQQLKTSTGRLLKRSSEYSIPYEFRGLSVPHSVDWRTQGVVSPVKDQGRCGSCWSFGAAEAIESQYAIATGKLHILSEQQILDCTPNPNHCGGTGGCSGATEELAFEQIIKMGGLASEWTYPYLSYQGKNFHCNFSSSLTPPVVKFDKYVNIPSNEYAPLLEAIAHKGPISVSVDASTWHSYESGIYDGCNQESPDINHAVLLVGYGVDRGVPYWLVRNSWSPNWGEDGYIRIHRRENFTCGIDKTPEHGSGCKDGPPEVKVCGTCGILYENSYPLF